VWRAVILNRVVTLISVRGVLAMGTGIGDWVNRNRTIEIMYRPSPDGPSRALPWLHLQFYPSSRQSDWR
jgi:hypothetical protein